jgi:4-alpha-glucanotransferase
LALAVTGTSKHYGRNGRRPFVRQAGILCHLTSLPSGRLGEDASNFLTKLEENSISVWQMLPITPPDKHGSPYASPSAFAIWENFQSQDNGAEISSEETAEFIQENSHWLFDWGLYSILKQQNNQAPWYQWPEQFRDREPLALERFIIENDTSIQEVMRQQGNLMLQWENLRKKAANSGVELFGDLPFFIAHDSADVWANRELFKLQADGYPAVVAGVPPDYFSEDGQRWGTVLYHWSAHREQGFRWWQDRMKRMFDLFDMVRIDHFRALEAAWAIPAEHDTAKHGSWDEGPADELLNAILEVCPASGLVAEDLGIIPPSVVAMRKRYDIPGMAVLHFAGDNKDNPHNPENHTEDLVVYTGTHDNDTTVGWGKKPVRELMQIALASKANLAIIPLQDVMGLGGEARMNTPGTDSGNWSWRFEWAELSEESLLWLCENVQKTGRILA